MIRKRVLGVGVNSATLLVQDADDGNALRVLRRLNVSDWQKAEVEATVQLYESIKRKSASMPHVVHIYTVLLQNTFLNIVMGFCEGGDLAEYLQNNKKTFPEMTVFRWLLVLAQALKELQNKANACFYGLALDHVFIDAFSEDEGAVPARLRMGLPISKRTYFTTLDEKQRTGSSSQIALDYPPEVLKDRQYHPLLSDIWHLGRTADQLLTMVNIPSASRSPGAQRLLEKMLSKRVENRPSVDQVITAMSVLAKLESNEPPVRPPSANMGHSTSRHPPDAATLPSARDVAAIRPRRRVSSNADWMMPPEAETSTTTSATTGVIVERLGGSMARETSSDRKDSNYAGNAAGATSAASRDLLTTPRQTGSARGAPQVSPRHGNRVDSARSSSWHRDAMERMEELERLNTNSPTTGRGGDPTRYASANRTPLTDERRRGSRHAVRGGDSGGTSSQRYIDAVLDMHINAGTSIPFHYDREEHGRMDHNTRVIKQMLGEDIHNGKSTPLRSRENGATKKKSVKAPKGPKGFKNPPFAYAKTDKGIVPLDLMALPDANEARSTDIKKSIKKWNSVPPEKENCVVTSSDGVFIYAPKLNKRDGEEEGQPQRYDSPRKRSEQRKKNRIPVSIAVPPGPPLTGENNLPRSPVQRSTPPPPPTTKTVPQPTRQERPPSNARSSHPPPPPPSAQPRAAPLIPPPTRDSPRRYTPPPPPPAAASQPQHQEMRRPDPSSAPRAAEGKAPRTQQVHHSSSPSAEPRRAPPPPPQQISSRGPEPASPPNPQRAAPTATSIPLEREDSLRYPRRSHRNRRYRSQDSSVMPHSESAMMEWAVDSIRSSIRSLVKDRTRYGEVMLEVAAFVRRPEEERLSVEENGRLVRRLHAKLQIQDDRTRDAAVSLCSQLVALEGLGKLLRENSQT